MHVPLMNLKRQYGEIETEIKQAISDALDTGIYNLGPYVEQFEKNFATYSGAEFSKAVSSGTSAIHLALLAVGVESGDEVIIPTHTFFATAAAVLYCGAVPVFVDCNDDDLLIDVSKIEEKITPKTKAIMPVHLYGQSVDIKAIAELAKKHNLALVEDCAQAHGASKGDVKVGTIGDIGCFSFYPGKNLGAYGEGGAIITNNPELDEKISILRNWGQKERYYHDYLGFNYRMDAIQGAILDVKLKYLPEWTDRRNQVAKAYDANLNPEIRRVLTHEDSYHAYHLFVIRTANRDEMLAKLAEKDIHCGIHYPVPVHMQKALGNMAQAEGSYPVTEKAAKEILSLPCCGQINDEELNYVVENVNKVYSELNG